ncbi:MAG: hypothetical protein ACD_76C00034G0003 [uncultured bacterium]|nr:MAG: hypothetical protein ACD_76C00034G0003 [uncultured bacterium]HBD05356.1 hypothetical protein [Candidatus Uhrbacteria bacterium]
MSHTPNFDKKIQQILDATKPGGRVCALTGEKWFMDEEEIGWYKKFNVPASRLAPLTRWWCQTGFFLGYQWWWNKHAKTGKPILTFVHPATGIRVLPDKEWFEEDFVSAGRAVDFKLSFFKQMRELQLAVPMLSDRNAQEPINSISKFSMGDVNSYFVMFTKSRNTLFSGWSFDVENCSELFNTSFVTNSFNIADSHHIHNCRFVRLSSNCLNSMFLFDCRNCEFCFGATNKRNKKYLWLNEQLSKDEWERRYSKIDMRSRLRLDEMVLQFRQLVQDAIWPENFNEKAIDSIGEYLTNVTRVSWGYSCLDGVHDVKNVNYGKGDSYDSADCSGLVDSNNCYYSVNSVRSSQIKYSYSCQDSQKLEYCMQCMNCEDCFGCIGLNRKKFCLLNKQYSEQDYWKLVDEIKCVMLSVGDYGEFLPLSMSTGYFPEAGARFVGAPKTIGVEKLGALDFDPNSEGAIGMELSQAKDIIQVSEVPDNINDIDSNEWVGKAVFDPDFKRRFSYLRPEIEFHKKMGIALSRKHFISRFQSMIEELNNGRLETDNCSNCENEIIVANSLSYPNRTIYCKPCYLQHIEQNG